MHKITDKRVLELLDELHKKANSNLQWLFLLKASLKRLFKKLSPEDMRDAYISISSEQGKQVYDLLLRKKSRCIVEYGTSFGISTLYLAAAVKENKGKVVSCELLANKCKVAKQNFKRAGLENYIELKEGDALSTLQDFNEPIDILFFDAWPEIYIPLLVKLQVLMKAGSLLYLDNADNKRTWPLRQYLRERPKEFMRIEQENFFGRSQLFELKD